MGSAPTEPSPMNEFMGDDACCPSDAIIAPLGARFDFVGVNPRKKQTKQQSPVVAKCSPRMMSPLWGLNIYLINYRGLTPTATNISPLRGSSAPTEVGATGGGAWGGHASGMPLRGSLTSEGLEALQPTISIVGVG